jgi:hypothetical protein
MRKANLERLLRDRPSLRLNRVLYLRSRQSGATSLIRLVAARRAPLQMLRPLPGHHHEALCDLGENPDASEDSNAVALRFTIN